MRQWWRGQLPFILLWHLRFIVQCIPGDVISICDEGTYEFSGNRELMYNHQSSNLRSCSCQVVGKSKIVIYEYQRCTDNSINVLSSLVIEDPRNVLYPKDNDDPAMCTVYNAIVNRTNQTSTSILLFIYNDDPRSTLRMMIEATLKQATISTPTAPDTAKSPTHTSFSSTASHLMSDSSTAGSVNTCYQITTTNIPTTSSATTTSDSTLLVFEPDLEDPIDSPTSGVVTYIVVGVVAACILSGLVVMVTIRLRRRWSSENSPNKDRQTDDRTVNDVVVYENQPQHENQSQSANQPQHGIGINYENQQHYESLSKDAKNTNIYAAICMDNTEDTNVYFTPT